MACPVCWWSSSTNDSPNAWMQDKAQLCELRNKRHRARRVATAHTWKVLRLMYSPPGDSGVSKQNWHSSWRMRELSTQREAHTGHRRSPGSVCNSGCVCATHLVHLVKCSRRPARAGGGVVLRVLSELAHWEARRRGRHALDTAQGALDAGQDIGAHGGKQGARGRHL